MLLGRFVLPFDETCDTVIITSFKVSILVHIPVQFDSKMHLATNCLVIADISERNISDEIRMYE